MILHPPTSSALTLAADFDVLLFADLAALWGHFDRFTEDQVLGVAPEQVPPRPAYNVSYE